MIYEFQKQIEEWSRLNLSLSGRYMGEDLVDFGFPYEPGMWIPVDKRYSAMLEQSRAARAKDKFNARKTKDLIQE